jgi:hypothetical protein
MRRERMHRTSVEGSGRSRAEPDRNLIELDRRWIFGGRLDPALAETRRDLGESLNRA